MGRVLNPNEGKGLHLNKSFSFKFDEHFFTRLKKTAHLTTSVNQKSMVYDKNSLPDFSSKFLNQNLFELFSSESVNFGSSFLFNRHR